MINNNTTFRRSYYLLRFLALCLLGIAGIDYSLQSASPAPWVAENRVLYFSGAGIFLIFFLAGISSALKEKNRLAVDLFLPVSCGLLLLLFNNGQALLTASGLLLLLYALCWFLFGFLRIAGPLWQSAIMLLLLIIYALTASKLENNSIFGYNLLIPATSLPLLLSIFLGYWTVDFVKGGKQVGDALPFLVMAGSGIVGIGLACWQFLPDPASTVGIFICGAAFPLFSFSLAFYGTAGAQSRFFNLLVPAGKWFVPLLAILLLTIFLLDVFLGEKEIGTALQSLLGFVLILLFVVLGHALDRQQAALRG